MRSVSRKDSGQVHFLGDEQGIARDAVGVAARVRIFFVDGSGEHLDGAHEQLAIFFGGALQVFDETFEFIRHGVESVGEFADFGAAPQVDALGEVAAGQGAAGLSEHVQGIGDAARGKDADANAQQHRQQGQQAGSALHLKDSAIGLALRLLHHDGPIQGRDRTVGAEHLHVLGPGVDRKFAGGGQLRLVAALDEVAHDVQVLHVLAGGKLGRGCGDEAALGIDDVGRQPAAGDFLQAAH